MYQGAKIFGRHFFPCQSLLLSTNVLNDTYVCMYVCMYVCIVRYISGHMIVADKLLFFSGTGWSCWKSHGNNIHPAGVCYIGT